MKNRTMRHLAMVAVAGSLALSGCVKDNPAANGGTFTGKGLRLHAEHPNDTKTTVDGLNVYWAEDDRVLINGTPIYVNVDGTRTQAEIDFDNSATDVLVVHPHTISTAYDPAASSIEVSLPCRYEYKEVDGRQHLNLPMVGKATAGAASITLKHICGAVDVQVTNNTGGTLYMDSITVASIGAKISGSQMINISDMDNFSLTSSVTNVADDMLVFLWFAHEQHSIGAGETRTFQVPVLPCEDIDVVIVAHSDAIPGVIAKPTYTFERRTYGKTVARAQVMSAAARFPDRNYTRNMTTFSVSDSKQVYFSRGNLIYHPTQDYWNFASVQTGYQGYANEAVNTPYVEWLDLFGWGTGINPTNTSYLDDDYPTFSEWGDNPIGTLGNTPGQWYTLSKEEWHYLVSGRPGAENRCGLAIVDGTAGLVLLPDNFPGAVNGRIWNYDDNTFTFTEWAAFEAQGAIFLPAAGYMFRYQNNTSEYRNSDPLPEGFYWTSSSHETDPTGAYVMYFTEQFDASDFCNAHSRWPGYSVRLVRDVPTGN